MKRLINWVIKIVVFLFLFPIVQVITLKYIPVYFTPLMIIRSYQQHSEERKIIWEHTWVPLEKISPYLPQAVVASEDNLFLDHNGFDFNQINKAREEAKQGKRLRGASTISQQTAKNVFLWNGKSYIRKGLEAYYTVLIEKIWGKKRIMEVYLNSIEMGNGIYGAEAVARNHFSKTAENLSREDAAIIAATLPNPIKFNSAEPSPYIRKRKNQIIDLMGKINPVIF